MTEWSKWKITVFYKMANNSNNYLKHDWAPGNMKT